MTEQANRIDWLERQLAQAKRLLAEEEAALKENPDDFAVQLTLDSWQSRVDELQQELRQEMAALQHEVVELRLIGARMDGSIPLRLLSKLADRFSSAVAHAAYHLRHGKTPSKHGLDPLLREIDLRLSGLAFGSTRLVMAGNIAPDTTGESAMGGALEQIFSVLQTQQSTEMRALVQAMGVPAARALSELMSTLEKQEIGAQLTWPAPNAQVFQWGGNLEAVRCARRKLSAVQAIKPEPVTLTGHVAVLNESGAIYIRSQGDRRIKIAYNKQQYEHVRQYRMGEKVELRAMRYVEIDELTGDELATFKLITDDE